MPKDFPERYGALTWAATLGSLHSPLAWLLTLLIIGDVVTNV